MVYIALLRGINVGGKNIIKMDKLKAMFENLGFQKVQTYIQSGNVIFESDDTEEFLTDKIEVSIGEASGFHVPVVLRTLDEMESMVRNSPFTEKEIALAQESSEGEVFYAFMFSHYPSQRDIDRLSGNNTTNDRYILSGRDLYILFGNSIRNSKLAGTLQKTEVPCTSRNFRTINQLVGMGKKR